MSPQCVRIIPDSVVGLIIMVVGISVQPLLATGPSAAASFLQAKTVFQTNRAYDPRIAIAVDGVIVHRHGTDIADLRRSIGSWKQVGYSVGRMFFADSDARNEYWTGKWDGVAHPEEVERNADGEVVKCAGTRPYMLPTDGWIRYLEEMTVESIDVGADAILPEEPLAHVHTGYERRFRELWVQRYGRPWQPERTSPEARFLTAQLKNELYVELERRLAEVTRRRADKLGRSVPFVIPVHGIYSNVAANLVAPLGTSATIPYVDGYIGQVWTGPVNWALAHYDSEEASFFASAYCLYDYFSEMTVGTGKKLWLLGDPVEDDPNHEWAEFEQWYRHCVVAKLLLPNVDAFEVMPWPDRIFLPGHNTGGGTPAPEHYRIMLLSVIQALQEMPIGGSWCAERASEGDRIGVAIADTLLWERDAPPSLQGVYGLFMPLVRAGVPVSACVLERSGDADYLSRFKVIIVSYDAFKPLDENANLALAGWVRRGGSLVIIGTDDDLDGAPFWWRKQGHRSPQAHLIATLGMRPNNGDQRVGRGWVCQRRTSPRRFADPTVAQQEYLPLVDRALRNGGVEEGLQAPGRFCMRRGPFVILHAIKKPVAVPGRVIDLFDADLRLLDGPSVEPGVSGLFRDVSDVFKEGKAARPSVLHATHRLVAERWEKDVLTFTIRGPAETPAVARLFRAGRTLARIDAHTASGRAIAVEHVQEGPTLRVRFPNVPEGVTVLLRWNK